MRRKSGLSRTSSASGKEALTPEFSIYDVPNATLEARHEARALLKHPDEAVRDGAQRIIDLLSAAIKAIGREDLGVLVIDRAISVGEFTDANINDCQTVNELYDSDGRRRRLG